MGRKPIASVEEKNRIGKAVHDYIMEHGCSITEACVDLKEKYPFNPDQLYKFRREYLVATGQWPSSDKKPTTHQTPVAEKDHEPDAESIELKALKPFDDNQFYSSSELMNRLNISRPTLYRAERSGALPKPAFVGTAKRWHGAKLNKVFAS